MFNTKLLFFFLLFCFGSVYPQQTKLDSVYLPAALQYDSISNPQPVLFNTKTIDSLKTTEDFYYLQTAEKDSWWVRFKRWVGAKYNQFIQWLFGDYQANALLALFIKILPYLLLILVLGLIIWLFSRLNPSGRALKSQKQPQVFLNEEEELVKTQDISKLITDAVKVGDYRLAIRYYYLLYLQKMDQEGVIDYKFQKTNQDYSQEITYEQVKQQFAVITKIYEFIWYGNFAISEKAFLLAEKDFSKMNQELKLVNHE